MSLWRRLRSALPSALFGLVTFSFALLGFGAVVYTSAVPGLAVAFSSSDFGVLAGRAAESAGDVVSAAKDAAAESSADVAAAKADSAASADEASSAAVLGSGGVAFGGVSAGASEAASGKSELYDPNAPAVSEEQDAANLAAAFAFYDMVEQLTADLSSSREMIQQANGMSSEERRATWPDAESLFQRIRSNSYSLNVDARGQLYQGGQSSVYLVNSRYSAQRCTLTYKDASTPLGPFEMFSLMSEDPGMYSTGLIANWKSGSLDGQISYFDQFYSKFLEYEKILTQWVATLR